MSQRLTTAATTGLIGRDMKRVPHQQRAAQADDQADDQAERQTIISLDLTLWAFIIGLVLGGVLMHFQGERIEHETEQHLVKPEVFG